MGNIQYDMALGNKPLIDDNSYVNQTDQVLAQRLENLRTSNKLEYPTPGIFEG